MNSFRATAGRFFRATGRALFFFSQTVFPCTDIFFCTLHSYKKKSVVGYRPLFFCLFLWISTFLDQPKSK